MVEASFVSCNIIETSNKTPTPSRSSLKDWSTNLESALEAHFSLEYSLEGGGHKWHVSRCFRVQNGIAIMQQDFDEVGGRQRCKGKDE